MIRAIMIDKADNVAMVTAPADAGDEILVNETGQRLIAAEPFGAGHKVALVSLKAGETAVKYGIPIGRMMSAVGAGGWVSQHNLEDTTQELCDDYCKQFRLGLKQVEAFPKEDISIRQINAFPRKNGTFGIRNYVMLISTTPETNKAAEWISGETGCIWFVCDKNRLEDGKVTEYTKKAMVYIGRNPNIYAALVIGTDSGISDGKGIAREIEEAGKPVGYISLSDIGEQKTLGDGVSIIKEFQSEAAKQKREPVSMEGFGLAVHCSGSDWTTAINGNSAVGKAADIVVKHGGRVFMTEWMEWSGSQHLMAQKCISRELGIQLLDTVDAVRATVLRETGFPVEYMNPAPANKEGGLTTLVEKSTGTIRKVGSTPIQGILEYCEQPTGKGVWLPKHDSVWPPTTAIYSSLSGSHMSVLNTGIGWLYFELPHMPCIRTTGNPVSYGNEAFRLDFNAGMALDGMPISEVGEALFEYIVRVAEGKEDPKADVSKERAFNMYYYTEDEFGEKTDRSKMLPNRIYSYKEDYKNYTNWAM